MTAHELAKELLSGPDLPVVINGWGSDEGFTYEVSGTLTPTKYTYTPCTAKSLSDDTRGMVIALDYPTR